eukprot:11174954-Lingulodinium_polyedra.AAC.1
MGPAEVIDVSRATRGIISVRWNTKVMEVQLPYIRRHLHFWVLLAAQENTTGPAQLTLHASAHDNV